MTENAKHSADDAAETKGRAEEQEQKPEVEETPKSNAEDTKDGDKVDVTESDAQKAEEKQTVKDDEAKTEKVVTEDATTEDNVKKSEKNGEDKGEETEGDLGEAKKEAAEPTKNSQSAKAKSLASAEFQAEIREQIENCKFEIISSLQESVHTELEEVTEKQVRKVERRRRAGFIVRDVLILILAAVVGYFGYCLYDAKYFDFMQSACEEQNNCETTKDEVSVKEPEEVKDTAWYQQRYGSLFQSLQTNLNADQVSAYYLYSDDYKVSEIQPKYLLAMAYNKLNSNITYDGANGIVIPVNDLRTAFVDLFGDAEYFSKQNFTYDCTNFKYDKNSDSFTADSVLCAHNANRKIVETVDQIYEEGNVMYFLTTATIFDQAEQSFYSFDNLFKPVAKNVTSEDVTKHSSLLNHYQYQFKKVDEKYYFSGVVKLN